jgi:hypothetical protein
MIMMIFHRCHGTAVIFQNICTKPLCDNMSESFYQSAKPCYFAVVCEDEERKRKHFAGKMSGCRTKEHNTIKLALLFPAIIRNIIHDSVIMQIIMRYEGVYSSVSDILCTIYTTSSLSFRLIFSLHH